MRQMSTNVRLRGNHGAWNGSRRVGRAKLGVVQNRPGSPFQGPPAIAFPWSPIRVRSSGCCPPGPTRRRSRNTTEGMVTRSGDKTLNRMPGDRSSYQLATSNLKKRMGLMRKITTAITAAALAFSMLASAVPAAAVAGYDSAYAGESAFVNITPGQTQNFQVFFANTGTTSLDAWHRYAGRPGRLSRGQGDLQRAGRQRGDVEQRLALRRSLHHAHADHRHRRARSARSATTSPPRPALPRASTGSTVTSSSPRPARRSTPRATTRTPPSVAALARPRSRRSTPNTGTAAGGTDVIITGSGIVCTPAFPTVSFGGTNGTVTSCGATSITVDSPAHALGAVTVTVTNPVLDGVERPRRTRTRTQAVRPSTA